MGLREIINSAILEYNKYRSPEAEARLISMSGEEIKIEFKGKLLLYMRLLRLSRGL